MVGFLAGARLAIALASAFLVNHERYDIMTFIIGGILGAILLLALFDWALILFLPSKAHISIQSAIPLPSTGTTILLVALVDCRDCCPGFDVTRISESGRLALVPEMPFAGEDHCDAAFVGGRNHFLVPDRSARLNGTGHACICAAAMSPSANGKKASLATALPASERPASFAFQTAMRDASIRDI